ncbi:glycosyltransferase [Sulfurimonas sp. ST-25]|uniref:glycosyltransferase n=1 Tax=Sulfurimonas sp. ST-25 TaxID=3400151 RepID=UPI003A8BE716
MKILFLTPQLPYPPNSGGTIKSYKLIKYLSREYDTSAVILLKNNDEEHVDDFRKDVRLSSCHTMEIDKKRNTLNYLKSLFLRVPLNIYRNRSTEMMEKVQKIINDFDVIIVDHYLMFQYIPDYVASRVILHQHNAEYVMWERFAELSENSMKSRLLFMEARRIKKYEVNICKKADAILAAPNDIDILSKLGIDRNKFYITYHLGNEESVGEIPYDFYEREDSLLYVGTLSWEANIEGLVWFIENTWDTLKARIPDLKLYIVGKNPDERISNAANSRDGIVFTGFVKDLTDYYSKCKIFIAPLRFGSGMKVKVVSAMGQGLPVVTTTVGAEGLDVEHMKHLAICDTADQMVDSIITLLTDARISTKMSKLAKEQIDGKYNWNVVYSNLKHAIESH